MHRASYRFMPPCGITETLFDVESVRVVHFILIVALTLSSPSPDTVRVQVPLV